MSNRSIGIFTLALTTALSLTAVQAQNKDKGKSFVEEAIQGDMAEIEVGKLAQQKSTDQQVKEFGQTLVTDHGENLEKAKSLAQSLGVTPPQSVNATQKSVYEKLSKLSGQQFDKQFAKDMVQDHKKDISKFERESKQSGPVADFAKETVPTLKKHLDIAESLSGSRSPTTGSAR